MRPETLWRESEALCLEKSEATHRLVSAAGWIAGDLVGVMAWPARSLSFHDHTYGSELFRR